MSYEKPVVERREVLKGLLDKDISPMAEDLLSET